MKFIHKRILIMFSMALNIGFVIVAITLASQHSMPIKKHSRKVIVNMVHRLNLPEKQEDIVLVEVRRFREKLDLHDRDLRQARGDILRLLAKPGPVDPDRLHGLIQAADLQEKKKNQIFENHVLALRSQLGDEKGALFFSYLLEHLESEDRPNHR